MKRKVLMLMVFLLVLSVGVVSAAEVELRIYTMFAGADPASGAYQELLDEFLAEHPEVRILDESATLDESVKVRIENDFAAGNAPDITMYFTDSQAKPILVSGAIMPLNDLLEANPEWASAFLPAVLGQVEDEEGNIYALPLTGFYEGIICNKDLFEKYDVKLPETEEELYAAIRIFNENNIVPMAAGLGITPHYNIEYAILKAGGAEGHDAGLLNGIHPSWVDGLNHIKELYDANAFQRDTLTQDWSGPRQLMKQERAAMLVEGSWAIGDVMETVDNVTMITYPKIGDAGNSTDMIAGFTSGMYLSEEAYNDPAKQEVVVELFMHLTSKDAIKKIAEANGGLPAVDVVPEGLAQPYLDGLAVFQNAENASLPIDAQIQRPSWQALVDGIAYIAAGRKTAEDVLKEVRIIELQAAQ